MNLWVLFCPLTRLIIQTEEGCFGKSSVRVCEWVWERSRLASHISQGLLILSGLCFSNVCQQAYGKLRPLVLMVYICPQLPAGADRCDAIDVQISGLSSVSATCLKSTVCFMWRPL